MYAFYVEFTNGKVHLKEQLTLAKAKACWTKYSKRPSRTALRWGWLMMNDKIGYQIIKNKAVKIG